MITAVAALLSRLAKLGVEPSAPAWLRRLRRLATAIVDPYRPEQHYMRGPGPKWREKHGRSV